MFHFRRAGALIAATTTTAVVLTATPFAAAAEADEVTIDVANITDFHGRLKACLLYTSPSPRDGLLSRMPSSA